MNNIASVCTYIFCKGDDGKFYTLVGKRTSTSPSGANRYTPPMGMVEDGENPYNAAVRECMEETGVRLPKHKIVYYDEETYPMQGKQYVGANFHAILDGNINDYPIGEGDGENEKFIWLPLNEINRIPWAFGTDNKMREIMNKLKIDMAKNTIRLTESELKRVISESVRRVLSEMNCKEDLQQKQHDDLEAHADERYLYDTYTDADNEYRRQAWVNGDMPTDEYINYDGHSNFIRKDGREYGSLRKGAYGNLGRKQSKNAIHNAFKNTPYSTYQMYNKK